MRYNISTGKLFPEESEFATSCVAALHTKPLLEVKFEVTKTGVNTYVWKNGERDRFHGGGLYVIYRKQRSGLQCLYSGLTEKYTSNRINRWGKGLAGKLRDDENHPGAEKALEMGVKVTDKFYVRHLDNEGIQQVLHDSNAPAYYLDTSYDEYVAFILNSCCNTRKKSVV